MIKPTGLFITAFLLCHVVTPLNAQQLPGGGYSSVMTVDQSMATGYSTLPEAQKPQQDNEYQDDGELVTDHIEFYQRGFMDFDWQTHTSYVRQVLDDVVIPDYVKRTGKQRPEHPSIDVAAAMITNPYFNDLIVQSRLPGDCKPEGCLVQIYSLVGEIWVKKFQTTTFAMLAKPGDKIGTVLLGLVGNEKVPSKTVIWTGSVFEEM